MNKREIYRSIIMTNVKNPTYYVDKVPNDVLKIHAKSETCIDDFYVYSQNDKVFFTGQGCSISTAALNLLCSYIEGMPKTDSLYLIKEYKKLVKKQSFDKKVVKDLIAFENVSTHLNRVACALIGANALLALIEGQNGN